MLGFGVTPYDPCQLLGLSGKMLQKCYNVWQMLQNFCQTLAPVWSESDNVGFWILIMNPGLMYQLLCLWGVTKCGGFAAKLLPNISFDGIPDLGVCS